MMSVMKKRRMKQDLTQEELGDDKRVNVSKGWISQIENGKDNCPEWLAKAIASVLRCNVDTLFKTVAERKTRYVARSGR